MGVTSLKVGVGRAMVYESMERRRIAIMHRVVTLIALDMFDFSLCSADGKKKDYVGYVFIDLVMAEEGQIRNFSRQNLKK